MKILIGLYTPLDTSYCRNLVDIGKYDKIISSGDRTVSSLNKIRKFFLDRNYDYLILVSYDMTCKYSNIEKLKFLIDNEYPQIITGVCNIDQKDNKNLSNLCKERIDPMKKNYRFIPLDELGKDPIEVGYSGICLATINKEILFNVKFRGDELGNQSDLMFCNDCIDLGYRIIAYPTIREEHYRYWRSEDIPTFINKNNPTLEFFEGLGY